MNDLLRSGPRVSVVLPTHNQLAFLPLAVESLQSQTFSDFEVIIVNDGCTDGTRNYLDQLDDPRIRVIHQENSGLPRALNVGFRAARGDLLTWTSSDNYCAPVYLEALVGALDAYPEAAFAVSAFAWVDEEGRIQHLTRDQDLSYRRFLCSNPGVAAFLYRRACLQEIGEYDPTLNGAEDWDMWLRIVERFEVIYVPELLYYYRQHGGSITRRLPEQVRRASFAVVERALARQNHELALEKMYPALTECADVEAANAQACFDFGTRTLQSPFWPPELACRFLEMALQLRPDDLAAAANLAIASARAGDFERSLSLASKFQAVDHPQLRALCEWIEAAARAQRPLDPFPCFRPDHVRREVLSAKRCKVFSLTSQTEAANA
jgi:hypothetical protein